ncbi:MAG: P-type conjugative transfer protein TrbG [Gammaproteobacteria bacterium]
MKTIAGRILNIFIVVPLCLLVGCAAQGIDKIQYQPAQQVIEKPDVITPANQNYRLSYGNNPALMQAFNQYVRTGKAPNIITSGFVQYAYGSEQQPVIATTPYQQTVITLEPGERFTNASTADPNRWTLAVANSGTGSAKTENVLVTPAIPNITTNLVITTDRRMYDLKLVSTANGRYVRDVRFWYPNEMVQTWNDRVEQQTQDATVTNLPDINLNSLNFAYTLSPRWGAPRWKPVRVFDDGQQTFIQMPGIVVSRDLPALFVLIGSKKALVNYRYKPPYFVVDKIFQKAILIAGVGSTQQRVTIINQRY